MKQRIHRNKTDLGFKDLYKDYKEVSYYKVNQKLFKAILTLFFKELVRRIIEESLVFRLPYRLGIIGIKKRPNRDIVYDENGKLDYKKSKLKIDFGETNKMWKEYPELKAQKKVVYHENDHSGNTNVKIEWNRFRTDKSRIVRNIKGYLFCPSREFKRNLAKHIKSNPNTEYYDF